MRSLAIMLLSCFVCCGPLPTDNLAPSKPDNHQRVVDLAKSQARQDQALSFWHDAFNHGGKQNLRQAQQSFKLVMTEQVPVTLHMLIYLHDSIQADCQKRFGSEALAAYRFLDGMELVDTHFDGQASLDTMVVSFYTTRANEPIFDLHTQTTGSQVTDRPINRFLLPHQVQTTAKQQPNGGFAIVTYLDREQYPMEQPTPPNLQSIALQTWNLETTVEIEYYQPIEDAKQELDETN